jgi:hypothetical protein
MNKMHRAQILLEPDQHHKLAEIAQQEGTSISEIVRTAVQEWLDERKDDEILRQRLTALDLINQHRQAILDRREGKPLEIDLAMTIEQVRGERDNELIDTATKHRN